MHLLVNALHSSHIFSACFDIFYGIRSTSTGGVYAFDVRVQQRNSIIIRTQVSGFEPFFCSLFECHIVIRSMITSSINSMISEKLHVKN